MRSTSPSAIRVVLVGLAALISLAACSDDEDPNAPAAEPVLDVGTGQCLFVTEDLDVEVSSLPVIDCAQPHTHEIFATVIDTESDVYPGAAALESTAERECIAEFDDFVGISYFDSNLFITWIVPSLNGWNDEDDREILCVLGRRDSGQLTGTAHDSKLSR